MKRSGGGSLGGGARGARLSVEMSDVIRAVVCLVAVLREAI